jgi:hypothetical protein
MTTAHEFTTVEADLLREMTRDARLTRAAFAGEPFRLDGAGCGPSVIRWPEGVVLGLIERGLMLATQQAAAWPQRGVPARPFTVALTKDGEDARRRILDGRVDLKEAA